MRTNRIVPFAALILAAFSNVRAAPQSESAAGSGEPEVERIPEIRLGERGMVHIKQLVWKASSPWFGKDVEVRRAATALSPETRKAVVGIAKAKDWKPKPSPVAQPGDHRYLGRKPHNILTVNDISGEVTCIFRDALGYKRDEQSHPVLEGFPPDEKLVEQCLEWLPKLGLERKNFQQDPNGPRGMDVFLGESLQLQDPDHPEHKITLLVPALRQHRDKYPLREPGTAPAEGESPAPPDAPANP